MKSTFNRLPHRESGGVCALHGAWLGRLRRRWLILGCIAVLTAASIQQANARTEWKVLTLSWENASLETVFREIRAQTGYEFLYNSRMLKEAKKVTLTLRQAPLDQALVKIFSDQPLTYSVVGKTIVVRQRDAAVMATLQQLPRDVKGQVVDSSTGNPLVGVSIQVQGTTTGTVTDADGHFSLSNIPDQAVLVVSYLGYRAKEVSVGSSSNLVVHLASANTGLDEVVVIGYGTQKRRDVTGAISSVAGDDFANTPITNVSDALAGRIAGLDITSSGGINGSGSQLLLRGNRSLTASNAPLIILDGMPYYGSIDDINPSNIKSVDVLKDASSTAIYGSQGANGVIIITTKRGQEGPPHVSLQMYMGPIMQQGEIPFMDGPQYAEKAREGYRAVGGYPYENTNPTYDSIVFDQVELKTVQSGGKGLDFQDIVFRNGLQQKYQLGIAGGSKTMRYNVSGNYFSREGIIPDNVYQRLSLRANLDFNFSSKVTGGASISVGYTENSTKTTHNPGASNTSDVLQEIFTGDPLGQMYDEDGSPRFALTSDGLVLNPMADYIWDSYRQIRKGWRGFANTYLQVKILPELTYRLNLGTTFNTSSNGTSAGYYSLETNKGLPIASIAHDMRSFKLYESILTYDKTFGEDHHLTLTAVQGFQSSRQEGSDEAVRDLPYEPSRFYNIGTANEVTSVASDLSRWTLSSFVGRIFYGYKSKYLLTMSLRADGASQFAPGHKWGYFPSAALAWRISEEPFMKPTAGWLSSLKLRLSYGVSGNKAINPYQTEGALERTSYSFGSNAGFGYTPMTFSNPSLTWESTGVYNIGLDFGLLNNRISGSIELYNTNTYDLLMYRKLPITTGFDQVLENVGETNNKGWEVSVHSVNIVRKQFNWSSDVSLYSNHTKIVSLFNGKEDDIGDQWFIGQPIHVFYDYKKIGIWQTGEKDAADAFGEDPGQIKVLDRNNDGRINGSDRMILGNPEPDMIVSFRNQFSYKSWSLSFLATARLGGMISVADFAPFSKKRYNSIYFDYWTPDNPTNGYPRPNQLYEGSGLYGSTLTYRNGSYIMLRDISLGYTIPKSVLGGLPISNLNVYVSAKDLWYWTKSELSQFHMKPDWTSGEVGTYPALRTIIFGVNVDF